MHITDSKNDKLNVLIISTCGLKYDGISSVIISYTKAIDKTELNIYVGSSMGIHSDVRSQIEETGCRVVQFPNRKKHPAKYLLRLIKFIRTNGIEVVHAHGNSTTLAIEMLAAYIGGSEKRIAHAHNSSCEARILNIALRPVFDLLYTDAVACSDIAGKWLFKGRTYTVLKNGRDINRYAFDENVRIKKQYELRIENNDIVIGHIGSFVPVKNHAFIMQVFRGLLKENKKCKLLLVGDGSERKKIESENVDIADNIIIIRETDNVSDYMQAMDVLLLPSLYEGLPLVVVEGQINGLPCIISDNITKECIFTDFVKALSITGSIDEWIVHMLNVDSSKRLNNSKKGQVRARESGFDICEIAQCLRNIYLTNESYM